MHHPRSRVAMAYHCTAVVLHSGFRRKNKAINYRCDDYNSKEKSSIMYFWEVIKSENKKEDEHENKKSFIQG